MDNQLRTERRASDSPSRDKPPRHYVILGAPDTGKTDLVLDILNLVPEQNLLFTNVTNPPEYGLGTLADYRAELHHAMQRFFVQKEAYDKGQNVIMTHSLIDSFAWSSWNAQRQVETGIGLNNGQQIYTATLLGQILLDSFYATHLFMIEGYTDSDDQYLYEIMMLVAEDLAVPKTPLYSDEKEQWAQICANIIENE